MWSEKSPHQMWSQKSSKRKLLNANKVWLYLHNYYNYAYIGMAVFWWGASVAVHQVCSRKSLFTRKLLHRHRLYLLWDWKLATRNRSMVSTWWCQCHWWERIHWNWSRLKGIFSERFLFLTAIRSYLHRGVAPRFWQSGVLPIQFILKNNVSLFQNIQFKDFSRMKLKLHTLPCAPNNLPYTIVNGLVWVPEGCRFDRKPRESFQVSFCCRNRAR
jgi:hypothetical protein